MDATVLDSTVLDAIVAPFTYGFMQRAMIVTLVAAVACALLSTWLVQMGWSLMGDAVSHSVLPGVALAYILGLPFAIGAAVFGIGAVALIGGVRAATRIKADAAIGVVFTTLFALGLVIISVTPSDTDLQHILFGNVLGVSDGDIAQVLIVGGIVCVTLLVLRRDLTLVAFDAGHAHAIGLRPRILHAVLLGALALTVVTALQAVGIILVVAMLVIPGATASLIAVRWDALLAWSVGITVVASLVGLMAAFWLDISPGGAVVLTQGLGFGLALLFGPRRGFVMRWSRARRHAVHSG
ncbi:metal ABC transporter permease [Agrococcus sp. ARC_14]|uniref:metal ABC transporter permease n=1 Tax=Agrococcus sp. ARC_14 TaxID=2919927 RepID=UPI001F059E8D|nr:metal ABC transporter permease [Agrococcus sp. ARC_14]MCH1882658.1 metal ABC transporter permease [Agrococcus sp. ARC_14]